MTNKSRKKSTKIQNSNEMTVDFGNRKINTQNKSKTLVLPREALNNMCGCVDAKELHIELVQQGKNKFLKLSANNCENITDSKK